MGAILPSFLVHRDVLERYVNCSSYLGNLPQLQSDLFSMWHRLLLPSSTAAGMIVAKPTYAILAAKLYRIVHVMMTQ